MAENKSGKAMKFFRETKAELKKVSWPSKSQLINNTVVILVFILSNFDSIKTRKAW